MIFTNKEEGSGSNLLSASDGQVHIVASFTLDNFSLIIIQLLFYAFLDLVPPIKIVCATVCLWYVLCGMCVFLVCVGVWVCMFVVCVCFWYM